MGLYDHEWQNWTEARPDSSGFWWFRLPAAEYGGVMMRPEWADDVCLMGMGHAEAQLWPLMSHWDGYVRTVPAGLQWRGGGPTKGDVRFPDLDLLPCPFCASDPTLIGIDRPAGGGARLYTVPFRPNVFKMTCTQCHMPNTPEFRQLRPLLDRWAMRRVA